MSHDSLSERQVEDLTPRLREVLKLIVLGYSNKDIGQALVIELSTVENHVHQLFIRMGVSNRTEAAVQAVRSGFPDEQ